MPGSEPAATILALRPSPPGPEVLMVHRNSKGVFGDMVVFPGGTVEDIDVPGGLTRQDELSHRNAALREFAEETGILITADGPVAAPAVKDEGYYEWLIEHDVPFAIDELVLVSRWVTPEIVPRRFDTRFYVVGCDDPPSVRIDSDELVGHWWVTAADALRRFEEGSWPMIGPTIAHLRWLRRWKSVDEALQAADGADAQSLIVPRMIEDGTWLPFHRPAELP